MGTFLLRHWFLAALAGVLALGFLAWSPLQGLASRKWISHSVVFGTMFALTWPLPLRALAQSVRRPGPPLLAFVVSQLAIPLMAWPLARVLGSELGPGMIVLAATPSTLASAAVWTRRAGGNDVVAVINTLLTNLLCFLVMPAWVGLMHGAEAEGPGFLGAASLLFMLVVLPMLLSQLVRLHEPSARWASGQKPLLGIVAQTGILVMVLIGSVQAGERMAGSRPPGAGLLVWMVVLAAVLHLSAWGLGFAAGGWLGMERGDRIGVAFSGSQKTLMIGLTTALAMGLSILPLVAYHMLQLVIDTFLADALRREAGADSALPNGVPKTPDPDAPVAETG